MSSKAMILLIKNQRRGIFFFPCASRLKTLILGWKRLGRRNKTKGNTDGGFAIVETTVPQTESRVVTAKQGWIRFSGR
jgi:hypothetical protein